MLILMQNLFKFRGLKDALKIQKDSGDGGGWLWDTKKCPDQKMPKKLAHIGVFVFISGCY